jgi:hypothetical protein
VDFAVRVSSCVLEKLERPLLKQVDLPLLPENGVGSRDCATQKQKQSEEAKATGPSPKTLGRGVEGPSWG